MNSKRLLIRWSAAVSLACIAGTCLGAAPDLVLVRDGVSLAPIVVFPDAPPYTRQAANELADYMEKTSGARPEILEGCPEPVPKHAIWVGVQPILKALFPELDFAFKYPEEILIAANADHLVITGRDVWDPDNMTKPGKRGKEIPLPQQEYGTVNAVYTFLQDYLDVRWFWPGETGIDIVEQKTIAFAPFTFRYHPQIRGRTGIFTFSHLNGRGFAPDWTRLQRLTTGSLDFAGGHAFTTWWKRFYETHPEYFALQPDGTRGTYPGPGRIKICLSNPGVWTQWLACVEEELQNDPTRTVFNAAENDGWLSGFCVCTNCRAWDQPDGEPRRYIWKGHAETLPALSDRQLTFANTLVRLLKERYPDKDYQVLMCAYGNSRPAPVKAVPDDNVIVSSVANFLLRHGNVDRGSTWGTTHAQQFTDWSRVTPNLVWRPNTGSPCGWHQGMPDVPLAQTARDIKFVAEHGCIGIFVDAVWEHFATQGPLYYLVAQLAWNPGLDPVDIMRDYYRRAFGRAAGTIEDYWRLLENKREEYFNADPRDNTAWKQRPGTRSYAEVYDAAFFDKAYGYLDRAGSKVDDEPDIYRLRIEQVRVGLDYTRLVVDCKAAMDLWRESGKTDAAAEQRVRANWDAIAHLSAEHPLAMNWGRLEPKDGRMAGFHPDGNEATLRLPPPKPRVKSSP